MKNNSGSDVLVFLYVFLVITGAYAIIMSLLQLKDLKDNPSLGSAIETKWFKFSGPAGFVYGLFAILTVIGIAKYTSFSEYRSKIEKMSAEIEYLKKENEYLQTTMGGKNDSIRIFKVVFDSNNPKSIFGGNVVVISERKAFSDSLFVFRGIIGVSNNKEGPFVGNSISYKQGDKFFIKLDNGEIWGVNVLNVYGDVTIEFYKR